MPTQADSRPDFEPDPQLFFTSLVPQETKPVLEADHNPHAYRSRGFNKDDERRANDLAWKWPPITEGEEWFRHSGWVADRQRVQAALRAAAQPPSRVERFDNCGCDCIVEYSDELKSYRLRANYCHDRFCRPCARARALRIVENLTAAVGNERLRFITVTLARDERCLEDRMDDLLASFTRLRSCKAWRQAVTAGAYFIEITRGEHGDSWHVHIHALVTGSYLRQDVLSDAWRKASKGSFIVDIRKVADVGQGVGYVAKYATKGVDQSVMMDPAALAEAVLALKGRRLLGTFGLWRNLPELDISVDYRTYRRVGTMQSIFAAFKRGEAWARGALIGLNKVKPEKGTGTVSGGSG